MTYVCLFTGEIGLLLGGGGGVGECVLSYPVWTAIFNGVVTPPPK